MPARRLQATKIVLASVLTWIKKTNALFGTRHYSTAYRLLTIITITTMRIIYTLIKNNKLSIMS